MADVPTEKVNENPVPHTGAGDSNAPTMFDATTKPSFVVAIGQRFGDYELLTEIARGGMGVVYRAKQMSPDRVVALKMIIAGRLANTDEVLRFKTEAGAAARLQHPNIVQVYDCEEHDGQHFFTMGIEGAVSIRKSLPAMSSKDAARYVRILARAVGYAQARHFASRSEAVNVLIDAG